MRLIQTDKEPQNGQCRKFCRSRCEQSGCGVCYGLRVMPLRGLRAPARHLSLMEVR